MVFFAPMTDVVDVFLYSVHRFRLLQNLDDALGGADGEIADIESKARARMPEAVKAVVKMITE